MVTEDREAEMAKKKYYAVKRGKTKGIYLTWEDCKSQVEGVPYAVYKSFPTIGEAEAFLTGEPAEAGRETGAVASHPGGGQVDEAGAPRLEAGEAVAYVDGSYNVATEEYSCGVVFFYGGSEDHICRKGEDSELASMRNVAGEILGARIAMQEAVSRGAKKLTIYHDYQGIASWCLGQWKTNKEGTRAYKEYFDSLKGTLAISFQKVKGHSGDTWNDLADELAKSAIF